MEMSPFEFELLQQKLAMLQRKQQALDAELRQLQSTINDLTPTQRALKKMPAVVPAPDQEKKLMPFTPESRAKSAPKSIDIERFIGENLANKIGAFITVLGVAIGLKYVIDNNLIGPVSRIVLGYFIGGTMFFVSQRLRSKYLDLSAVILSAALCIAYFTSYAAHVFYHLIPQAPAFLIMLFITTVAVWQALVYNRQVIAIGSLVGAYFIPFLLSDGSDRPVFLFIYMGIVNCGILYIALQRSWKVMQWAAFVISWWILNDWCSGSRQIETGLTFLSLFFVIFTAVYVAEKLLLKMAHKNWDTAYLIFNALFFFFPGYRFASMANTDYYSGLFILANMAAHLGLSYIFFRRLGQSSPFGLLTILGLICLALFFPDQFDNPILTICWSVELIALFWIGRRQKWAIYEQAAIPMLVVLGIDILFVVTPAYYRHIVFPVVLQPLLNEFSSCFVSVIAAVIAVFWINKKYQPSEEVDQQASASLSSSLLLLIGGLTYIYFFNEISAYFDIAYANSYDKASRVHFEDISAFKIVWLINYTLLFLTTLNLTTTRKDTQYWYKEMLVVLGLAGVSLFLVVGLYQLGFLKNCYMSPVDAVYERTTWHLWIRYLSMGFLGLLLWSLRRLVKSASVPMKVFSENFDLLLYGTALWMISSELVHWLELYGLGDRSYKIALSILFGCWSVMLTILGIRQSRKILRIAAISLFTATLLKLFMYDLEHLSTIAKTVVMVALGGLLLAISFLYNKFKADIL